MSLARAAAVGFLLFALLMLEGCAVTEPKPDVVRPEYIRATYLLVPGWLADWGSGAGNLGEIEADLKARGIPYVRAPVRSRNTQAENAAIVYALLMSIQGELVIVSGSRGTSEAALAIAKLPEREKLRIRAWISISSAHNGSLVANYYSGIILYPGTAIWSALSGWGRMQNIVEMRVERSRDRFSRIASRLADIPTVSIVTTTSDSSKFEFFKKFAFNVLESTGEPHDGLILARDQVLPGSRVIYCHGQRHMLDDGRQVWALDKAMAMVSA